jgi:hypothetical protein
VCMTRVALPVSPVQSYRPNLRALQLLLRVPFPRLELAANLSFGVQF